QSSTLAPILLMSSYVCSFTATPPTASYTLSLHDALPIFIGLSAGRGRGGTYRPFCGGGDNSGWRDGSARRRYGKGVRRVNREDEYTDDDVYDGDDEPRFSRRKWIGATLAILIVVGFGIGIWHAYDQDVKKGVQLAPPIISADKSPVKVAPAAPRGMEVPNQDKQVLNVLNWTGT